MNRHRLSRALLGFGLLAAALPPASVSAATICVNAAGAGCPNLTISAGIAAASAGDIVSIAAGTYNEAVTVDKSLKLVGVGTVIVDAELLGVSGDSAVVVSANGVSLANLTVRNGASFGIFVSNGRTGFTMTNVKVIGANDDCVYFEGGNSGAKITLSTLRACDDGINFLADAPAIQITSNTISLVRNAIRGNSTGAAVTGNKISVGGGSGITVNGDGAKVSGNQLNGVDGDGIVLVGINGPFTVATNTVTGAAGRCLSVEGDAAAVTSNVLTACGTRGIDVQGAAAVIKTNTIKGSGESGIRVTTGPNGHPHGTVITGNRIASSAEYDGIEFTNGNDALISANTITGAYEGIFFQNGNRPTITLNTITNTACYGIYVQCYDEQALTGCTSGLVSGNKVTDTTEVCAGIQAIVPSAIGPLSLTLNTVTRAGAECFHLDGTGIVATGNKGTDCGNYGDFNGLHVKGASQTISNNVITRAAADGFHVEAGSAGTTLSGNTSDRASEDGFDIHSNLVTLTGNKALASTAIGFETNGGTSGIDLTGNVATGSAIGACLATGTTGTVTGNTFGTMDSPAACSEGAGYVGD